MDKGLTLTDSQMKAVMTDRISNRIRVVLEDSAGTILTPISVSCDGNTGVQWKIKVKTGDSSEGAAAGVGATVQWSCDGSTWLTLMTGHIDDNGAVRNQGYVFDDTLTFTVVDMTSFKGTKRKPSTTAYAGYYICNPADQDKSLVHILGRMMGVTAFDVGDLSAYVKDIVELGSNSVWQELQALAECYDADLAFTSDGKLYFHSPLEAGWTGKTPDWTLVATRTQEGKISRASSVIGSISRTAPSATCNRARSTFSAYERGTAGVIYRDTTNWNEATKTCHITIPGKTRYPESGYLSLKYKDPDSGEEYPYAVDVETPKIGGRGYPIYAVGGKLKLISFDGSTADTQKVSGESQIVLYNESSDTCTIEGLEIYGIPYRKTAESTVEEVDSSVTDEVDYVTQEVEGKYATDATQLSAVLARLVARGKTIHRTISLSTSFLPQVQVGEVMRLVTDDEDDIWEVTGFKHTMKGAQMSTLRTSLDLVEVTDYTPAAAPRTVVRHPQTARQTTAQTQIEYAAWANADLPPVPNGTYVIDGVARTITDSSLSEDEAETYWSTEGSLDTQAGDFIWMRTRTGGDTWIYQIVTSRQSVVIQWAAWPDADIPPVSTGGTFFLNGKFVTINGNLINGYTDCWSTTYPSEIPEGWYVWQRIKTESSDWAYTIATSRKLLELTATATQWHYTNRGAIVPGQLITLTARATGFSPSDYTWIVNGQERSETGNTLTLTDGSTGVVTATACGFTASIELTNIQDTILSSAYLGIQDSLPESIPATVITEDGTAPITTADPGQRIIKGDQVVLRTKNDDGTYSYVPYIYYNGSWQSADSVPLQYSLALTSTISDVLTVANAKDSIQAYNVFTNLLVSKTAITDQLAATKAFIKNLKVGQGTGIAGSGFRFRAMQDMDETGKPLTEPVFDVFYGDKQLFAVDVDSGEISFGSQFVYSPSGGSIHTLNNSIVIASNGDVSLNNVTANNITLNGGAFAVGGFKTVTKDGDTVDLEIEAYSNSKKAYAIVDRLTKYPFVWSNLKMYKCSSSAYPTVAYLQAWGTLNSDNGHETDYVRLYTSDREPVVTMTTERQVISGDKFYGGSDIDPGQIVVTIEETELYMTNIPDHYSSQYESGRIYYEQNSYHKYGTLKIAL